MSNELITHKLSEINNLLVEIKKELKSGHKRMDAQGVKILKLEIARKNAIKVNCLIWAASMVFVTALLNTYFQAKYLKPKSPVAQTNTEATK